LVSLPHALLKKVDVDRRRSEKQRKAKSKERQTIK
jgi:hypothetical protein